MSSGISLRKLFLLLIAMMAVVTSTFIFVYSGETAEEIWKEREIFWKQQEIAWQQELEALEKQKEQVDLVLSKHFIDHKLLHMLPYTPSNSHAIVTAFGEDDSERTPAWILALVLFQSLNETKTRVPNKIAFSYMPVASVPLVARNAFIRLGVDLRFVGNPPIESPSEDWRNMWMRSQAFLLTEFSRVLFMDCQSIAIDNIDHVLLTPVLPDHPLEDSRLVFYSTSAR